MSAKARAIFLRELRSWFTTPLFYVLCSAFLLLSAFFFFSLILQFNAVLQQSSIVPETTTSLNEWVILPLLETLEIVLVFLIPVVTMRLLAEERRTGTFELLKTSPLSASEIVAGKYFALLVVLAVTVLLSAVFPASLVIFSDPEVAPILVGYAGLLLFAAAFGAIGLFVSSLCSNQTISGVLSLVVFLVLYLIDTPAEKIGGTFGRMVRYLTPASHTESFVRGVLQGDDIFYFISLIFVGVFLAARALEFERLR
ncbi:MAG: ABC transporter permease [Deltaproteobacteria bacterium]|nr:ABC transporter permease [Deltaproteobacteria bacterium]